MHLQPESAESLIEGVAQPYAFTGREYDPESGLFYYRARYYDANAGRFISQDPIGFRAGDANFYRYVFNNPVNFRDPSGLAIAFPDMFCILTGSCPPRCIPDPNQDPFDLLTTPIIPGPKPLNTEEDKSKEDDNEGDTVEDILEDASPGRKTKGKTKLYEKDGGLEEANEDFDRLGKTGERPIDTVYGPGRAGTLPNGDTVVVRPGSSDHGRPTVEVQKSGGRGKIEIRYGE